MNINKYANVEVFKFATVGFFTNLILYIGFVVLTTIGFGEKSAMTMMYAVGVVQGFILNKRWTFKHNGSLIKTFLSYALLYALGYILNLFALIFFVDNLGFNSGYVQAIMICVLALFFFAVQKTIIFKNNGQCDEQNSLYSI